MSFVFRDDLEGSDDVIQSVKIMGRNSRRYLLMVSQAICSGTRFSLRRLYIDLYDYYYEPRLPRKVFCLLLLAKSSFCAI